MYISLKEKKKRNKKFWAHKSVRKIRIKQFLHTSVIRKRGSSLHIFAN